MAKKDSDIDSSLKLLAKSSLIVLVGIFMSKILSYIYRIIIARYYGPEVYGLFSLAAIISGFFIVFSALGLNEGLLRYIAFYRGKKQISKIRNILKISLTVLFFSGIIAGIILFLASDYISIRIFHNYNLIFFLRIFSFAIPLFVLSQIFLSIIRAYERIGVYSFAFNILQNFIKVLFLVIFIAFSFNSDSISFSYVLGIFSMLIFSYFYCKYKIPEVFLKDKFYDKKLIKNFFSYSWPLLFFGVAANLLGWIDSLILGYLKSMANVGIYNAVMPIALLLTFAPELFTPLFFPLITKKFSEKSFKTIEQISKQVTKWIFIINLPIFIIMILFPGAIINILFGPEYLIASDALRILAIGALVYTTFNLSSQLISMTGRSKTILVDMVLTSIVSIILNFILIPQKEVLFLNNETGLIGAALATAMSWVFFSVILVFQTKKYLSITPVRRKMINIALYSLIPIIFLLLLRVFFKSNIISLILIFILFILVYVFIIFITKSLDNNDLMIIRDLKRKLYSLHPRFISSSTRESKP